MKHYIWPVRLRLHNSYFTFNLCFVLFFLFFLNTLQILLCVLCRVLFQTVKTALSAMFRLFFKQLAEIDSVKPESVKN